MTIYNKTKLKEQLQQLETERTHCSVLGHEWERIETLNIQPTGSNTVKVTSYIECLECHKTEIRIDYEYLNNREMKQYV